MANSSGIITAPVRQIADVKTVLGESVNTLSGLCKSSKINRWAKYKPVKYANVAPNRSGTWWQAYNMQCGIDIKSYSTISAMLTAWMAKTNYAWEDFWKYDPPTGGTYPYRLFDFNNYKHTSTNPDNDKPFPTYSMPDSVIRYFVDGNFVIGANASIYKRSSNNDYLLTFDDINVPSGAATVDLANMYFSMAFVYNYTSATNKQYSFQSTYCKFNVNATSDTHDDSYGKSVRMTPAFSNVSLLNNGDYLAFPFLSSVRLWDTGSSSTSNPVYLASNNAALTANGIYVPLPYAGKIITVSQQTIYFSTVLTATFSSSHVYTMTLKATNKTTSTKAIDYALITYTIYSYQADSSGNIDYQNPSVHTGTWGTSSANVNANATATTTKTVSITWSNYGGYIQASIQSSVGTVESASTSLDY